MWYETDMDYSKSKISKRITRSFKSKKYRQYNGQKKKYRQYNDQKKKNRQYNGQKKKNRQ